MKIKRMRKLVYPPSYDFSIDDFTGVEELKDLIIKLEKWMSKEGLKSEDVAIEFDVHHEYGYDAVRPNIYGSREETDEDIQAREKQALLTAKQHEDYERKMFEDLKKKYGS